MKRRKGRKGKFFYVRGVDWVYNKYGMRKVIACFRSMGNGNGIRAGMSEGPEKSDF